ncbi:ABC transporter substrate-binding protein [Aurantimonas sp. HBX-1]|uniref:ABC transporter substrate-binding protein n=1 Tax=Aurantimonas sp. HBX-1 TaxID=2906072 RepID=UPI001F414BEB|nr:ABC transporter substrate-binding protein [Aurantimonas sp. HBX-1]UIJ72599.1 ABC transporter substrate-binding protein [Aurantimonas sp. HBX-1]
MFDRAIKACLLTGLALGSLGAMQAQAAGRPDIVVAVADNPPTLEPAKEMSNVGTRITYSVFDTLIRRDFLSGEGGGGAKLVPSLATSWERIDDTTLELKLREGVTFHNGAAFNADDVVFTFSPERLIGEASPLPQGRAYFGVLDRVEKLDDYTVRFVTKAPDPLLEQRLASWASWIVDKDDWLEKAAGKGFAQFPVGTGPYMLDEYRADQYIRLDAFDQYWDGRPTAATVTFRKVPEPAARIAGLVSGEFDIITNVAPDQIAQIDGYDDIETRSVVLANSHVLVYNTDHPVLADKRIRQAMNLAIDRNLLVEALWNGDAVVPNGHQYPEYGDMYQADRPGFGYDPEKARQLLAEAGYNGETIVYSTEPQYYLNALPAAQAILEMWKAVGINAELNVTEDLDSLPNDELMVRNWSNSTRYPDPVGGLWNTWGPYGSAQKTWESWTPETFNQIGAQLETTLDHDKRFELAVDLMDTWEDDAPGTILYQPLETYGVRKSLKWQPYTFYYMDLRPSNLKDEAEGS